jgi:vitamin B12 transporter
VFDPATFLYTARNKDLPSERHGVELSGALDLAHGVELLASWTWLDATEQGPDGGDIREVRRPRNQGSLGLDWRFANERANLNLNVVYTGDQDDLFFDPVSFAQETVVLDSHTVIDLAASWRMARSLELYARVTNLSDADYEEVLGFVRPGRAFYAGLRGQFGF